MLSLLTRCRLERALNIIEHSETIQTATLEVSVVIVGHADYLLVCLHLFDNSVISSIENLNIPEIQRHQNETIIAQRVIHFEFTRHLLLKLEFVSSEKVKIHLVILTDKCIYSDIFDKLR